VRIAATAAEYKGFALLVFAKPGSAGGRRADSVIVVVVDHAINDVA